jgi:hypothetical protein
MAADGQVVPMEDVLFVLSLTYFRFHHAQSRRVNVFILQ